MQKTLQSHKKAEATLIQKFVLLLREPYLSEFKNYLRAIEYKLSLRLVEVLSRHEEILSIEEITQLVYGKSDEKTQHALNQLASLTFKKSGFLAVNFPAYLFPNAERITQLVNNGYPEKATLFAGYLLDIAEKAGDYQSQAFVLKFLAHQAYLYKDMTTAQKHQKELKQVFEHELTFLELNQHYREKVNPNVSRNFEPEEVEKSISYVQAFFNDSSDPVRLLAKVSYTKILYFFKPALFESDEFQNGFFAALLREFNNYAHVIFPFPNDFLSILLFYKVNNPSFNLESKVARKDFDDWSNHHNYVRFWKHYLNMPEVFSINVKTNFYTNKYLFTTHQHPSRRKMDKKHRLDIESMLKKCEEIFDNEKIRKKFERDLLSMKPIYCSLLLILSKDRIPKAIQELESLLIVYQQLSLGNITDTVFLWLIVSYFSLGDYEKCTDAYNRYVKISKGKIFYEENDIVIHAYYYLAQWMMTKRKQYIKKYINNVERGISIEHGNIQGENLMKLGIELGMIKNELQD